MPAVVGAINPGTLKLFWSANLGRASAIKTAHTSDGKFFAVLIGDRREGMTFAATEGSQNTLYLLNGATGKIIQRWNPLEKFAQAPWANDIWQNLDLTFKSGGLIVKGNVFCSNHPNRIYFEKKYRLPASQSSIR